MVSFPSGFPTKSLCTPLPSSIRATCSSHLILLDFITRTILGEQYSSLNPTAVSTSHINTSGPLNMYLSWRHVSGSEASNNMTDSSYNLHTAQHSHLSTHIRWRKQALCQEITRFSSFHPENAICFRKLWPDFTINVSCWESNFLPLGSDATLWSTHWSLMSL